MGDLESGNDRLNRTTNGFSHFVLGLSQSAKFLLRNAHCVDVTSFCERHRYPLVSHSVAL
jgi:hypothetical protein